MTTVQKIKTDIQALPHEDYMSLLSWIHERDWEEWDKQLEMTLHQENLIFLYMRRWKKKSREASGLIKMPRTTNRFWACLDSLPKEIQKTARKNLNLL